MLCKDGAFGAAQTEAESVHHRHAILFLVGSVAPARQQLENQELQPRRQHAVAQIFDRGIALVGREVSVLVRAHRRRAARDGRHRRHRPRLVRVVAADDLQQRPHDGLKKVRDREAVEIDQHAAPQADLEQIAVVALLKRALDLRPDGAEEALLVVDVLLARAASGVGGLQAGVERRDVGLDAEIKRGEVALRQEVGAEVALGGLAFAQRDEAASGWRLRLDVGVGRDDAALERDAGLDGRAAADDGAADDGALQDRDVVVDDRIADHGVGRDGDDVAKTAVLDQAAAHDVAVDADDDVGADVGVAHDLVLALDRDEDGRMPDVGDVRRKRRRDVEKLARRGGDVRADEG